LPGFCEQDFHLFIEREMIEPPRLSQEAMSIISQILEYWEQKFFIEGFPKDAMADRVTTQDDAKLYMGRAVNSKLKYNGAWNFHSVLREMRPDRLLFETIFSRPTIKNPVPQATASAWFDVSKKVPFLNADFLFIDVSNSRTNSKLLIVLSILINVMALK
jgi:hypothetical protein